MAKFFIDRPIFAIVIALLIMLAGALSIIRLPIELYPTIAPPSIQISSVYPGASAQTVESTVVQVIEQQMSGLDHLLYMSSTSDDTGQATIILTFEPGTNADIAQVQVQNKLSLATPILPQVVQQQGLAVTKSSTSFLLVAGFVSSDPRVTRYDISDYVASKIQDPISRIDGVGNTTLFGTQYAMRIWTDPNKLNNFALTPVDVRNAITAQNVQIAGGQLGGTPAPSSQRFAATITEATLLRTPQEFADILLKVNPNGSQVRMSDVARIELNSESFALDSKYNHQPASAIGIQLATTGANALKTADAIRARIQELSKYFPPGLRVVYPYDTTPFVRASISEVVKTLFEAIALVCLVMYLFLQSVRATIIPAVAVPVVLLGTFAVMGALGFTINTLSMFGLVLAIGLLVDDAIVVVENVERLMDEEGLSPRDATVKAMEQITGALVGVALVLSAVFVPVAFSSGSVGAMYRQFALTIVVAMLLSVFVALTLSPALCAMVLRARVGGAHGRRRGFFGWFNRTFENGREHYVSGVRHVIARAGRWFLIYGLAVAVVALLFVRLPTGFLPDEDQGYVFVQLQAPPGASQNVMANVLDDVNAYIDKHESQNVDAVFQVNGFNFAGRGQNQGLLFVQLKDWAQRPRKDQGVQALMQRLTQQFANYPKASVIPINPPPIRELGTASGFDFELVDRGGVGHDKLMEARDHLLALAHNEPTLQRVRPNGLDDNPTFNLDIDREKAKALGVDVATIDQSFSTSWGSTYVNNFLDTDGRIKRVFVQADAPFRMNAQDLRQHYVRNATGGMVPISAFATGRWTYGSPKLERYNGVSSIEIQGEGALGVSTGQAMATMDRLAQKLPAGLGSEWTGLSLQERLSGAQAPVLYAVSMIVVFLSLAALYESWSIPISVILVVPLGVLGALAIATAFGLSNDVYFQVGLLTTIGLSAKNAILIVEFARNMHEEGKDLVAAALEAAHLRLRPILMTSMAFILGVLPLALATGAGAASRNAIGTGVIGGMLTATFLAPFLIPMFYVVIARVFSRKEREAAAAQRLAADQSGGS
jgi:multidrug efflux pump